LLLAVSDKSEPYRLPVFIGYTPCSKNAHLLFCCSFLYKHRLIFVIFGTQYTEVSCNTTQQLFICPLNLHTVATLLLENLNFIIMTLLTNVKYCGCTYGKISCFPHNYYPTELNYYNKLLFHLHGLNRRHKPGPVNLVVSRAVTQLSDAHITVLAHCLARRCQRHSNGTSKRNISCTSIQLNIRVICNSKSFHWSDFEVI